MKQDSLLARIGVEIRRIRANAKETQREMAETLCVSHAHICNLENGKVMPSLDLLTMIRRLYSLDPYILAALNSTANVTMHIDWNERKQRESVEGE